MNASGLASGLRGFPDFMAHASELSSHAHQHRSYSGKEPMISVSCQPRRIFSVPLACRYEALNHAAWLPPLVSPTLWAVGIRSIESILHVASMSVNRPNMWIRSLNSRSDRPNDHNRRNRAEQFIRQTLPSPCHADCRSGHRCAAARSRRDAKRLACVYILRWMVLRAQNVVHRATIAWATVWRTAAAATNVVRQ